MSHKRDKRDHGKFVPAHQELFVAGGLKGADKRARTDFCLHFVAIDLDCVSYGEQADSRPSRIPFAATGLNRPSCTRHREQFPVRPRTSGREKCREACHLKATSSCSGSPCFCRCCCSALSRSGSSSAASMPRQSAKRRALASALANTLDQDLSAKIVLLETLRLSPALRHGDFKSFYSAANEAHEKTGNHILLVYASGRQIFNTHAPYGAQLPSVTDGESVRRVIKTKQATSRKSSRAISPSNSSITARYRCLTRMLCATC